MTMEIRTYVIKKLIYSDEIIKIPMDHLILRGREQFQFFFFVDWEYLNTFEERGEVAINFC